MISDTARLGWKLLVLMAMSAGLFSALCQAADSQVLLVGKWGGDGVNIVFGPDGAHLDYDCAVGSIATPTHVDAQGRFSVMGLYESYQIGPDRVDSSPKRRAASYDGHIVGAVLELHVRVEGESVTRRFRLDKDRKVKLARCL